jgi:hypothetical protein
MMEIKDEESHYNFIIIDADCGRGYLQKDGSSP